MLFSISNYKLELSPNYLFDFLSCSLELTLRNLEYSYEAQNSHQVDLNLHLMKMNFSLDVRGGCCAMEFLKPHIILD